MWSLGALMRKRQTRIGSHAFRFLVGCRPVSTMPADLSAIWPFLLPQNAARGPVALSRDEGLCRGLWLAAVLLNQTQGQGAPTEAEHSPIAVILPNAAKARALTREIECFTQLLQPGVDCAALGLLHLPEIEGSPYADVASDPRQVAQRLGALWELHSQKARVVVGSVDAWRRKVLPAPVFEALVHRLTKGQECERDDAAQRLHQAGYLRVDLVEDVGTYAVRGNVIDVFSPGRKYPARIEWWGDEIETIRTFDPRTQRSLREFGELEVLVARESIVSDRQAVRLRLFALADALEVPSSQSRKVLDNLLSGHAFFGMEALVPLCHEGYQSLLEVLPESCRWVAFDPQAIDEQLQTLEARDAELFAAKTQDKTLLCPLDDFFCSSSQLRPVFADPWIRVGDLEVAQEGVGVQSNVTLRTELDATRAQKRDDWYAPLLQGLQERSGQGWDMVLVLSTQSQRDRMLSILDGSPLAKRVVASEQVLIGGDPEPQGRIMLQVGTIEAGFALPEARLWVLSERDIFGQKAKKTSPRRSFGKDTSLSSLSQGDYIVHVTHGVGRYHGLARLDLAGVDAEFVLVEYANKDRLYLPVHRVNEIEAYGSVEGKEPKLDRLGGVTFAAKTKKVRLDARMLAEELLTLYAQREAQSGFAYPALPAAMQDFAATFPYEPTADQQHAIDAVLKDLQSQNPMDRLICGDVGFGKTEVALRACFFVATHGKQVAVLAPTTILAQQHLHTFRRRFANFPLEVQALHRFVPAKARAQIVADLRDGKIDVIVGTHALLSSEVQFKELGLVVVDEEQRFGVRQKERFKRLKTKVDMLTLSATPIPRTLHMGLMGMREISMITTPPSDRLSVRTQLARDGDVVIQKGIAQELGRGGQVYFVVPRIEGIMAQARRIQALAPDARVGVAHGNMTAAQLEKVMIDFVEHRLDVLVCTSIVESGLDIPRANTIFIARAELFGMSQLYQLRGRVGRSSLRAHCFLLVNSLEKLSEQGRRRLDAIVRHCELGAGFSVASQDLELRGAGDLLGKRQSGSIAKVGFQAYTRALQEAVAEARGLPLRLEQDPELNVDIPAFLSQEDIEDTGQRVEVYRRLSVVQDADALRSILAELNDRYGKLSLEAQHYGLLMLAKLYGRKAGASAIELRGGRLGVVLSAQALEQKSAILPWVSAKAPEARWASPQKISFTLPERTGPDASRQLEAASRWLAALGAVVNQTTGLNG